MSIRAIEDFFQYHNASLESLHLPNKSCIAQKEVIHGVTFYVSKVLKADYVACGGKSPMVRLEL